jgi:hypothetical protein
MAMHPSSAALLKLDYQQSRPKKEPNSAAHHNAQQAARSTKLARLASNFHAR